MKKYHLREACLSNAKRLLREADRMLKRKKYAWATFLAITSFEESMKLSLLNLFEAGYLSEKKFNNYWQIHEYKLRSKDARIRFEFDVNNGKKPKLVLGSKHEAKEVIKTRNSCLYVGYQDNLVHEPKEVGIAIAVQYINDAVTGWRSAKLTEELSRRIKNELRNKS